MTGAAEVIDWKKNKAMVAANSKTNELRRMLYLLMFCIIYSTSTVTVVFVATIDTAS